MKRIYDVMMLVAILGFILTGYQAVAGRPTIVCIPDMVVSNDVGQCSAVVTFSVLGGGKPTPTVTCVPPSGSAFPVGRNTVSCTASNNSGTTNCSFGIRVLEVAPPQITCPADITVECAGFDGTVVPFTATAIDLCDTNVLVACTPPAGSAFSRGTTVVTCFASNSSSNTSQCAFTVTVQDTTPPLITCPTNIIAAEFPHDSGFASVPFAAPVTSDICDASVAVDCAPPSESSFPVGITTVRCAAADDSGNTNSCTFTVRVIPYRLHVVTTTADTGNGSLRQALQDANDAPGENLIVFNIPGTGPFLIDTLSPLPVITSPIIVDGYSQTGISNAPVVEMRGNGGEFDGLVIAAGRSIVQGLALNQFRTAIRLEGQGGNIVRGNYIGTDLTGLVAPGNTGDGVYINSQANTIGGLTSVDGNVISGNEGNGIHLSGSGAAGNLIRGNLIGTAFDGASALENGLDGVFLENGASGSVIGGILANSANTIAFNARNGVSLASDCGSGNAIRRNRITANGALGIDLGADGVTANDAGDADSGPNQLQNFPILSDVRSVEGITTIEGTLNDAGSGVFQLDFYLSDTVDPSGFGEGAIYLGSLPVSVHGAESDPFAFSIPYTAVYTQYVAVTATDADGNTSEFSRAFKVRTPPVLEVQPVATNVVIGTEVTFCATASGTPPLYFQWRLNGVNVAGATNECYTIPVAQIDSGGTYTVVVYNELGALATVPVPLDLSVSNAVTAVADNFADRVLLTGTNGVAAGINRTATLEAGEPLHANKPGGKSVWYKWTAPVTGILTLGTLGSTFDTLLAVYTGTSVTNLTPVASDEDRGGFFTSGLRFNAINGTEYQFAIDGFGGAEGSFILNWIEEDTSHLLPQIVGQPISQTVAPGSNVTFVVVAQRACGNGHGDCPDPSNFPPDQELRQLQYQWYFNDVAMPGQTNNILLVPSVQISNLGHYSVTVSYAGRTVQSKNAELQMNLVGSEVEPVLVFDKFLDAANSDPLRLGFFTGTVPPADGKFQASAVAGFVSGYTGLQTFNNTGSTTESTETPCGTLGGASDWMKFIVADSVTLGFTTAGTPFETVLALYIKTNSLTPFKLAACGRNSLSAAVTPGAQYMVGCDGVGGATGPIQLGCNALVGVSLASIGRTPQGYFILQVVGQPGMHFALQGSFSFTSWTTISTNTLSTTTTNIIDTTAAPFTGRFYRVQTVP